MFLPRRAWANWEDGPSSSDDDSIVSDVVPTTLQEQIEQFIRRGRLYKERKLERKMRREAAEEAAFDTPPPKYKNSGDLAAIRAAHKSELDTETDIGTKHKGSTKSRSKRTRGGKSDPTLESFFPKVAKTKQLFYEMPSDSEDSLGLVQLMKKARPGGVGVAELKHAKGSQKEKAPKCAKGPQKEKAPVIRRLPPPCSDDDSETEFV
jgi:hypothetical protein